MYNIYKIGIYKFDMILKYSLWEDIGVEFCFMGGFVK